MKQRFLSLLKQRFLFLLTVAILSVVTALCIKQTVLAKSSVTVHTQTESHHAAEDDYVRQIRQLLDEKLLIHSGVTMTKISFGDGHVEYTVKIHNNRIDRLSSKQQKELLEELGRLYFDLPDCAVYFEFF